MINAFTSGIAAVSFSNSGTRTCGTDNGDMWLLFCMVVVWVTSFLISSRFHTLCCWALALMVSKVCCRPFQKGIFSAGTPALSYFVMLFISFDKSIFWNDGDKSSGEPTGVLYIRYMRIKKIIHKQNKVYIPLREKVQPQEK